MILDVADVVAHLPCSFSVGLGQVHGYEIDLGSVVAHEGRQRTTYYTGLRVATKERIIKS